MRFLKNPDGDSVITGQLLIIFLAYANYRKKWDYMDHYINYLEFT
jgi:hypothetical protein